MPKIYDTVEQGSEEWLRLRMGRPTASEFHRFMTTDFELRKGEMLNTYLHEKLVEAWTGHPLQGFSSFATEQGSLNEGEALPWYELEHNVEARRVGFVEHDDGRCGCSPDGLLGEDKGIEIKSPEDKTHVGYLLAGRVPPAYSQQVHGSLYVTGRKRWTFLSYSSRFPKLMVVVNRDESTMAKIGECLAQFYARFDVAMAKLKEME